VREQHDRLGDVANLALGEQGLVVLDQRDDVPAGDVPVIDDGESRAIELEAYVADASPRNRRANRACVEHAGKREVVDVPRGTADLFEGVLSWDVGTDGWHPERMESWGARGKRVNGRDVRCRNTEFRIQKRSREADTHSRRCCLSSEF
jgi:hypothetical protein